MSQSDADRPEPHDPADPQRGPAEPSPWESSANQSSPSESNPGDNSAGGSPNGTPREGGRPDGGNPWSSSPSPDAMSDQPGPQSAGQLPYGSVQPWTGGYGTAPQGDQQPYGQPPSYGSPQPYGGSGGGYDAPGGYGTPPAYGQPPEQPGGYPTDPYGGGSMMPGGYPPAPVYGAPYGGYGPVPQQHPQAVTALVLGIVGLTICPPVGIGGLVLGGRARREIDAQPQHYSGRGVATAGWVLGILSIVYSVAVVLLVVFVMTTSVGS